MKISTAKTVAKITAIVTAVAFFASLSVTHEILAILLAGLGYFVMCAVKVICVACKHTWRWCTDAEYRTYRRERKSRLAAKNRAKAKAQRTRAKFLDRHDEDERHVTDLDVAVVGSIAWLSYRGLDISFPNCDTSTFDHKFDSGMISFDNHFSIAGISSLPGNYDMITGGTDFTGMNGLGGHHDQPIGGIDHGSSFSSHDSFGSGM
jgi:hypothetical protein